MILPHLAQKMAEALKIVTLVASFALAVFLGLIFTSGFFQASIHAKEIRGDLPLPHVSSILFQNYRALIYIMVLPWLGFAMAPVVLSAGRWRDNDLFLLCFAAFISVESFLTLFLLFFLLLPFIPNYMLMDMRPNTVFESIAIFGFWIIIAIMLFLLFRRSIRTRRKTAAKQSSEGNSDSVSN